MSSSSGHIIDAAQDCCAVKYDIDQVVLLCNRKWHLELFFNPIKIFIEQHSAFLQKRNVQFYARGDMQNEHLNYNS